MARCMRCDKWLPVCKCDKSGGVVVHTWKPIVFTDICETPILIESKRQLREECKKHKVKAECLM